MYLNYYLFKYYIIIRVTKPAQVSYKIAMRNGAFVHASSEFVLLISLRQINDIISAKFCYTAR